MRRSGVAILLLVTASITCAGTQVTVLYTNDLHARLSRLDSLTTLIESERATGDPVLLFDAGDAWQDFRRPLQVVWGAGAMVDWMNRMEYSAMAVGNHEFYLGARRLERMLNTATFPVLSANYLPDTGPSPLASSVMLGVAGVRILVVGLTAIEMLPFGSMPSFRLRSAADVISYEMAAHEADCDFVFVVGHVPVDTAATIARRVPGIALFITGHSHERTEVPVVANGTIIVQSGQFGESLGRLRLDLDRTDGSITVLGNALLPTKTTPVDVRPGVVQLLWTTLAILGTAALMIF